MSSDLYDRITLPAAPASKDVRTKMYRGFGSNTDNFSLYDFELIKQDILNHFNIRQGEKLMNPEFGSVIWDVLFEPLTEQVKSIIVQNVSQIINYDPRVTADEIVVTSYETGIQISCSLTYLPYNISQKLQLRFDQANGLLIQQ